MSTASASPDHLVALKKLATIFETAASSRKVLNKKNLPHPASVKLASIHLPQTQKNQVKIYSTPVTTTPELLANVNISAPTSITYNESELGPPSPPMFNHHRLSTHQYPTRALNGPQHLINCVLK